MLKAKAAGAFSSQASVGSRRSCPGNYGWVDVGLQDKVLDQGTFDLHCMY